MEVAPFTIPLQAIEDAVTQAAEIRLFVLRTDLNHPFISGNKLFKLKYNLLKARQLNHNTLLTFGGAFSNHIAATAAAGREYGFKTIGIIRGEESAKHNPTLQFAAEQGMQLHFVSRSLYRDKELLYEHATNIFSIENFYLIPEGGSNDLGVEGCKEITTYISNDFDVVCSACGTGATISGIILSLKEQQRALGFQVLKAENYIAQEVKQWIDNGLQQCNTYNWTINEDYHFGGYAKVTTALESFVKQFETHHHIPLDYVYTGKMMFGIYDLLKSGYFEKGKTIIAVHTGGLQGNKGFNSDKI